MCLTAITSRPKPNDDVVAAWKAFDAGGDLLYFPLQSYKGDDLVPRGKWIQAQQTLVSGWVAEDRKPAYTYLSGFHCFLTKKGADEYRCGLGTRTVKVLVKRIRIFGEQEEAKSLVSDWMYVPAEGEAIAGNAIKESVCV